MEKGGVGLISLEKSSHRLTPEMSCEGQFIAFCCESMPPASVNSTLISRMGGWYLQILQFEKLFQNLLPLTQFVLVFQ